MSESTFSAPGVDLFLGDAAIIVPSLICEIDLLVTDPPYGIGFKSNFGEHEIMVGDRGETNVPSILCQCVARMRPSRHLYVFGSPDLLAGVAKLTAAVQLVWDKENVGMGDLELPRGISHENINFAIHYRSKSSIESGRGRLAARLRQGSVLRSARTAGEANKRHPTEKPVDLMRQIIESSSCFGELVLDPFLGSGSTAIAALLEGRRVIGIEKDPKWFNVAKDRVTALLPILTELTGC